MYVNQSMTQDAASVFVATGDEWRKNSSNHQWWQKSHMSQFLKLADLNVFLVITQRGGDEDRVGSFS